MPNSLEIAFGESVSSERRVNGIKQVVLLIQLHLPIPACCVQHGKHLCAVQLGSDILNGGAGIVLSHERLVDVERI